MYKAFETELRLRVSARGHAPKHVKSTTVVQNVFRNLTTDICLFLILQ